MGRGGGVTLFAPGASQSRFRANMKFRQQNKLTLISRKGKRNKESSSNVTDDLGKTQLAKSANVGWCLLRDKKERKLGCLSPVYVFSHCVLSELYANKRCDTSARRAS